MKSALVLVICITFGGSIARGAQVVEPVYLLKAGHLPKAHWYSIKPGKPYYIYRTADGGEAIFWEKLPGVLDTRPISQRNTVVGVGSNLMSWAVPSLIMAGVAILGAKR